MAEAKQDLEQAKYRVLAIWPAAYARFWGGYTKVEEGWRIECVDGMLTALLGCGDTKPAAWIDAAANLPAQPVAEHPIIDAVYDFGHVHYKVLSVDKGRALTVCVSGEDRTEGYIRFVDFQGKPIVPAQLVAPAEPAVDWNDNEAVVRAALPEMFLDCRKHSSGETWRIRTRHPRVQAFERQHNPAYAQPLTYDEAAHRAAMADASVRPLEPCAVSNSPEIPHSSMDEYWINFTSTSERRFCAAVLKKDTDPKWVNEMMILFLDALKERGTPYESIQPVSEPHQSEPQSAGQTLVSAVLWERVSRFVELVDSDGFFDAIGMGTEEIDVHELAFEVAAWNAVLASKGGK